MLMITLTHTPTRRWCSLMATEAERLKDHGLAPGGTLHAFVPGSGTGPVKMTV